MSACAWIDVLRTQAVDAVIHLKTVARGSLADYKSSSSGENLMLSDNPSPVSDSPRARKLCGSSILRLVAQASAQAFSETIVIIF